jgi:glycogen debranching enzyme
MRIAAVAPLYVRVPPAFREGPTLYPVACAPQSWSAGAVFLLIQSCLGLMIEAAERRVSFVRPMLPDCIPWMLLHALRVGDARVDVRLERHGEQVLVEGSGSRASWTCRCWSREA